MEPVEAGMKFGTLDSRLSEMQARADKIHGKIETYQTKNSLGFGLADKKGKFLPGSIYIEYRNDKKYITFNSFDGNYQYEGIGDTFMKVKAYNSTEWVIDKNKNGVVDANELKNRRK